MATVQSYTKTGVDNKVASRSNVTLTYSGTGTPELSAFPDAKTGDVIERTSDRAQWRVLGNTLVSLGHIVTKVNGLTGEVNLTAAELNASPTGHKHTIADITDLTVSKTVTADHVVQRTTDGNITVPTTPNANTSAASKSYVDSQVSGIVDVSHTHTKSDITDLETISTTATANHIVKRITGGNITVPTTPNASGSATSKSYVDTEVAKKANTSHTHGISDVSGLQEALNSAGSSVHTHVSSDVTDAVYGDVTTSPERLVKTDVNGYLRAPAVPTAATHAVSKHYVDTEVGKKANTSHTHTISQITDLAVSTGATADHVVKRITSGNITVPTTPNANTSATSKSYVDSQVSTKANASHTHTISDITDLTVSTGVTANHVPKRLTSGDISVPTTPSGVGSATSKSYVDAEVGKKANSSHTHAIADVSGLQEALAAAGTSEHTHVSSEITDSVYGNSTSSPNRLVKTGTDGYLQAPITPTASSHSASKSYVDTEVGKKANTSHTHTKSQITDLETISTTATADHVVKRITSGNITVPTTPNASTSAASKSYVDTEVGKKANTSHTHTKSNITDLETISTAATGNHIVKRNTDGNITVPATPAATTSATSKSYVDTEVGKKANTSHTHTKSQITDLETISTQATVNHLVKRVTSGEILVPHTPTFVNSAASKYYVETWTPKIQIVNSLPSTPEEGVVYFVREAT